MPADRMMRMPSSTVSPVEMTSCRRHHDDVAQVEVVGRDEDGHHLALAAGRLHEHLGRDEAEDELALARVLGQHDGLERLALLGRERFDELLDGRVDAAEDRHPDEQPLHAPKDAAAEDVGGDACP